MHIIDDFERAQSCLRETVRLLGNVAIAHPEAEPALMAIAHAESTDPGVRAMLKVLLAMGTFVLAQERLKRDIIATAEAQSVAGKWVN